MKKKIRFFIIIGFIIICITSFMLINKLNTKNNSIKNNTKLTSFTIDKSNILKNSQIEDITYDKNKVNIYFFYGEGCSNCEKEIKTLELLQEQYGEYFNLYTFEVWYNKDNLKIAKNFAQNMGDELKGVPYTIIGDQSYLGVKSQFTWDFIPFTSN